MKIPILISCISLFIGCKEMGELDLVGNWLIVKDAYGEYPEPFSFICPSSSYEFYPCQEKLYITTDKIEHPLGFALENRWIVNNFISYDLAEDHLVLFKDSLKYIYDIRSENSRICFADDRICLERETGLKSIDSTILIVNVKELDSQEVELKINYQYLQDTVSCEFFFPELEEEYKTSIATLDEFEIEYLIKLLERIPESQLNRIYNNSLSHCNETSIDFYDARGNWVGIETCGKAQENPFEIRAFVTNLEKIMVKYIYE